MSEHAFMHGMHGLSSHSFLSAPYPLYLTYLAIYRLNTTRPNLSPPIPLHKTVVIAMLETGTDDSLRFKSPWCVKGGGSVSDKDPPTFQRDSTTYQAMAFSKTSASDVECW